MRVNKTLKEIKAHGTRKLPLEVYEDDCRVYGAIYMHWHKEYEMIFITSGKGELRINQKTYCLKTGDFILIGSEELHYIESDKQDILAFQSIVFDQSIITGKNEKVVYQINKHVFSPNDALYDETKKIFLDLIKTYFEEKNHYKLLIRSDLLKLTYLMLKAGYIKEIIKNERTSNIVMQEICEYINSNFQEDLRSEKLAEMAGYSKFHFTKVFKDYTGKTVVDYIHNLRMNRSLDLLLNTDLSVSDIALDLGYDNVSYFIKRFKTLTGKSPSQYKKDNLNCSIIK